MSESTARPAGAPPSRAGRRTIDIVNASLKRRYAAERRFRRLGLGAVLLGLAFVAVLLISIVAKGYTAFWQTYIMLPVSFDPAVIDSGGALDDPSLSEIERNRLLVRVNFLKLAREALRAEFPSVSGRGDKRALYGLLSPGAPLQLRDLVAADPGLIGSERSVRLLADDDVDMLVKGHATGVDAVAGEGTAIPSAVEGAIGIRIDGPESARLLDAAQRHLSRQADRLERELERTERRLDEAMERAEQAQAALAAAGDADEKARERLQARALETAERVATLERRRDDSAERLAALRARAAATDGAEESLGRDMPSWLMAINGGVVKLTAVAEGRVQGEVITPLETTRPAAPGGWQLLELAQPAQDRRLSDQQIAWVWQLQQRGLVEKRFNTLFFTNGTSREPEMAGIAAALVGSFYTLLLTLLFSFPIAVGAAVYLEEFAPKNRLTDLIEVNINNLAAVPSIVFGLLGLAVFINFFGVPRSTPLVAAMVLTLMTLPTIIIASRAALKSVPPSIREAALGVGASPLQTQIHHVLPLALPGMLTGTIIGMAQALGETAPLLMIGLIAFIVDVPGGITDPATVLPVQVFMWADSPERGFVERTSAAIMVLLGFLILMNLAAVLLRRRFERRW